MSKKDFEQTYKRALKDERTAWQNYEQHLDGPEDAVRQHFNIWLNSARQVDVARDTFLRSSFVPDEHFEESVAPLQAATGDLRQNLERALQEQKSAFAQFERRSRKRGAPEPELYETWLDTLRSTNSARSHLDDERRRRAKETDSTEGGRRPRTELVGEAQAAEDDSLILRALAITALHTNVGATEFRAGIRNAAGVVYRTVTLLGVTEKVNFARHLETFGYEDERFSGRRPPKGYDLMYSKPRLRSAV